MNKRFKILAVFAILSFSLSIMSNTYSRYVADTTGNVEVLFSKWQLLINNSDITNNSTTSVELTPVIEENVNVKEDTFAPTSKGYFDISVDPSNVEVSFDYTISLGVLNESMPDLMITKYALLDSNYVEGDEIVFQTLTDNSIKGTQIFNRNTENFQFESFIIRVYFEWYDGTDNLMDDEDDTKAAIDEETFKVSANISFEQKI